MDILRLANSRPVGEEEFQRRIASFVSSDEAPINMEDMIYHFLTLDFDSLYEHNQALGEHEILKLFQQTRDYLVLVSHVQKMERVIQSIERIQKGHVQAIDDLEMENP